MPNSLLSVTVIEARDLNVKDAEPLVQLEVEDQEIETKIKKGGQQPVWNEAFEFKIKKGESLRVEVINKRNN
jgi:Ca2+-dependent lipid-binding protein